MQSSNTRNVVLPTQVKELPTAVHETIRQEKVTEVQPIVNIERDFTQVRQKTQPILDKEIKNVAVTEKTLPTQQLPTLQMENRGVKRANEVSTTEYRDTKSMTIEKPAIYNEIDKTQIIEEIQPVIYKETVVPSVLKETAPSFQKIVEGATYTNQTLPTQTLPTKGTAYVTDQSVPKGISVAETLPTQRVELPTAMHEQIRREKVTEIQPVVNVEKDFTHVIQKTQPILDKEIKNVQVEQRTLDTKVLPTVNVASKSVAQQRDTSSINFQETQKMTIQKPAIYNEIDKTRIIEEIQPVIYKETVVPEVLKETAPSFQRIVEGTTYSSEVLPPIVLNHGTTQPVVQQTSFVQQPIQAPKAIEKSVIAPKTGKLVEEKTTTVTSTTQNIPTTTRI